MYLLSKASEDNIVDILQAIFYKKCEVVVNIIIIRIITTILWPCVIWLQIPSEPRLPQV